MNPKVKQVTSEIITVLLSLIILLPIFMMIINSFKDYRGATRLSLTLYDISIKQIIINYSDMLKESHLLTAYKNSAIITFISVFLIVFVGAVSAFIIQRRQNRITKLVNLMFILGISIPFVAPSAFFLVKQLGLSQTYSGIILIYLATSLTTSIILFTGYYKSISTNLDVLRAWAYMREIIWGWEAVLFPLRRVACGGGWPARKHTPNRAGHRLSMDGPISRCRMGVRWDRTRRGPPLPGLRSYSPNR
jgi:hypothetical protein